MKPYFGICKDCKKEKLIINAKGRCKDCQYIKNNGKSRFEAYIEKEKQKPIKIYRLKRKTSKKRLKPKKKSSGEYAVFLEIWKTREHICVNCKKNLDKYVDEETQNPSVFLFSHIKTKGSRVDLRLDKNNIELLCPECHFAHEHIGDKAFKKCQK